MPLINRVSTLLNRVSHFDRNFEAIRDRDSLFKIFVALTLPSYYFLPYIDEEIDNRDFLIVTSKNPRLGEPHIDTCCFCGENAI